MTNRQTIKLFLKGLSMGAADVVPGVSGGTVAFVTGVYDELLKSINSIRPQLILTLIQRGFGPFWREINGRFLLTLGLGVAFSIISLANVITYLLSAHPIFLWSLFLGLIVASSLIIGKQVEKWSLNSIISTIGGCIVALVITSTHQLEGSTSFYFIFFSGCISICAMILPGISGSFILVLLGMYSFILNSLKSFDLPVIITFSAGCAVGLLSFSTLLSYLLKTYRDSTLGVLLGFMLGSLNKVWPWKVCVGCTPEMNAKLIAMSQQNASPFQFEQITGHNPQVLFSALLILVGFSAVLFLEHLGSRNTADSSKRL